MESMKFFLDNKHLWDRQISRSCLWSCEGISTEFSCKINYRCLKHCSLIHELNVWRRHVYNVNTSIMYEQSRFLRLRPHRTDSTVLLKYDKIFANDSHCLIKTLRRTEMIEFLCHTWIYWRLVRWLKFRHDLKTTRMKTYIINGI